MQNTYVYNLHQVDYVYVMFLLRCTQPPFTLKSPGPGRFHDLVPGWLERSRTQCGPQSPGGATGDGEVTHCSWDMLDMSTSYDWDRKSNFSWLANQTGMVSL